MNFWVSVYATHLHPPASWSAKVVSNRSRVNFDIMCIPLPYTTENANVGGSAGVLPFANISTLCLGGRVGDQAEWDANMMVQKASKRCTRHF